MPILDTINVVATDLYSELVLGDVFRYTGTATESTTEMKLKVETNGGTVNPQLVKFRKGGGGVFIHDYQIAIPASTTVVGFTFTEIGASTEIGTETAAVSLTSVEQKHFDEAGILYIDEIRFRLNVSLQG